MRYTVRVDAERMKHTNAAPVPDDWADLIDRFLATLATGGQSPTTIHARRQHLGFLARRIGRAPHEVDAETLIVWCAEQAWAPESRRGRSNTFRYFWRWAERVGVMPDASVLLPKVRATPGIPRPTPDRVYMKAIMRSDVRTRLILRLAAECGLRRGEIALAHSDDMIDDFVGWSLLVHGKGNKDRVVPLTNGIANELNDLDDGFFFPGQIAGHLSPRRVGELATDTLDGIWTLHTLRHRFATRTYQIDHDVFAVQELLGHASAETTRRYVQTDRSRLRALVELAAS